MLIDCREISDGHTLSCDICIIGAGAAGITLAKSYLSSNLSVCLMESGVLNLMPRPRLCIKGGLYLMAVKRERVTFMAPGLDSLAAPLITGQGGVGL